MFNKRLSKQLKHEVRERRFVNYTSAKTVVLLFESDFMERNAEIRQLIQTFNADGKKVMAWGYVEKKEISTAILPDFRILHQKDVDFTGLIHEPYRRELEELTFDLLIDLTVNEVKPLQYIALYSNAACKAGTHSYPGMYDVIVDTAMLKAENTSNEVETTAIDIYNQLFFYLKNIQTND